MSEEKLSTLNLPFEVKAEDIDEETGYFKGHAAAFGNVDSYNDVIERGAFSRTIKKASVVPILWYHNPYEPVGKSISMVEDEKGLLVEGELALELQKAKDVHVMLKKRIVTRLSIGFRADPKKQRFETVKNRSIRYLQDIELLEFSPVVFAANQRAKITSVKAATTTRELERALREEGSLSVEAAKYVASRFTFPNDATGGSIDVPREAELLEGKALADLLRALKGYRTT